MAHGALPLEERFFKYVEFDPNSGCWLWSGATTRAGYGSIYAPWAGRKRSEKAHRVSWEMFKGERYPLVPAITGHVFCTDATRPLASIPITCSSDQTPTTSLT